MITRILSISLIVCVFGIPLRGGAATQANSIKLTENYTESLVASPDGAGGTTYAVVPQVSTTLNMSLTVPGIQTLPSDLWSNLDVSISVGSFGFSENLSTATTLSSTKAGFNLTGTDDLGNVIQMGQITLTRSANTLTIAGQLKFDIAAVNYLGTPGPILDAVLCNAAAGDFQVDRYIYITGKNTITHRTVGSGDMQQDFDLNAVQISGAADFTAPTVTILSPSVGARLTNSMVTVQARATDNTGVADVQVSLNGSDFASGEPSLTDTNVWSADFDLEPGTNILQAISLDFDGNVSATNTVKVTYVVLAPLEVQISGLGTVTTNYNGKMLEVGKKYTMTAKPGTGFAFTNWTGSIATNSPTLTFLMDWDLSFTANFVDVARPTNTITSPTANQRVSSAVFTIKGTAKDNGQVAEVWCQANGVWGPALTTNVWTNWTAAVTLLPGTNTVRAYAVDATGNRSLTNAVSFIYAVSNRLTLIVTGKGTVSPGYSNALLELGKSYTLTATPGAGYLFSNWIGTASAATILSSNAPKLTFSMASNLVLRANFVTNLFLAAKGTYNGLFYPATSQTVSNSGYFTLTLADSGAFSGRLMLAGSTTNFTGAFDIAGQAQLSVRMPGSGPLQLTLFFSPSERSIDGWVSSSVWQGELRSDLAAANNSFAGGYTMLVPGSGDAAASPPGTGAGTVTVSAAGTVTVSGTLAEGTAISQTTGAAADGSWPLYVSLYGGRGLLFGPMKCNSNAPALWIKPSVPTDRYYSNGFAVTESVIVARYTPPTIGQSVLKWTNGAAVIGGGNLSAPLSSQVILSNNLVRVVGKSISNLSLTITLANGLFSGTFIHPVTRKSVTVKGALLQDPASVYPIPSGGWFLGTNQGGSLQMGPILTAPVVGAPSGVSAISFTVTWLSVPGSAGYELDVSTNSDFSTFRWQDVKVTGTNYVVTGLVPETQYYFRLRAFATGMSSGYSGVFAVTSLALIPVASETVATNGGTITIPHGSPIEGLQVQVPPGAYTSPSALQISYSPVANRQFSTPINPLTPLITLDGGGQTSLPLAITVPLNLSSNEFAMGFLYNLETGELEPMQMLNLTNNSITIALRRYPGAGSQAANQVGLAKVDTSTEAERSVFVIGGVPYADLFAKVDEGWCTSRFRPGQDDWEFQNPATFVSVNGNCAGTSETAIWYYKNKNQKENAIPLHQLYSQSHFGFDSSITDGDALGMRLVSAVQYESDVTTVVDRNAINTPDLHNYAQFVYAMITSHQPQLIGLYGIYGHAVIAFAADSTGLYIADPNYPGDMDCFIPFSRSRRVFDNYNRDSSYSKVRFLDCGYLPEYQWIPRHWERYLNKTVARGLYPVFNIAVQEVHEGAWESIAVVSSEDMAPVKTHVQIHTNSVRIKVEEVAGGPATFGSLWSVTNLTAHTSGRLDIPLAFGTNYLGILLEASPGFTDAMGWSGYTWLTVAGTPAALPATEVTTNGFTANWLPLPGSDGYAIDVSTHTNFSTFIYQNYRVGNGTNVTFSGLSFQPNTTNYYRVRAYVGAVTSENSETVAVVLCGCDPSAVPPPSVTPVANMAWIRCGTFVMGSPTSEAMREDWGHDETQHTVTLTKGFYMGKYAVTQGEYLALMGYNPSYFTTHDINDNPIPPDLSRPVEQVSWYEATAYCVQLTAQEQAAGRLPAGWVYRLPTESEREYACRAGTTTAFNFGSGIHGGMANFSDWHEYDASIGDIYFSNPAVPWLVRTTSVGSYQPNAWGLHDMHGNVWEWCQDWYGSYPTGSVIDPQGPNSGSYRVFRGGCWYVFGRYCQSVFRNGDYPSVRDGDLGFRVVLAPGQP